MISTIISSLKTLFRFFVGCLWLLKLPFKKEFYSSNTYFPELSERRKSRLMVFIDQVHHILKYGVPDEFYFLYGLDIKGLHKAEDFVDNKNFMRRQYAMNTKYVAFPPIPVLRDKALFGIVAEAYGINTAINVGFIQNEYMYLFEEKRRIPLNQINSLDCFTERSDFFIKKIDGQCADGVYHMKIVDGKFYYENKIIDATVFFERKHRYLIQEAIKRQHPAISKIHSKAINTLRVVTVYNEKKDEIEHFSTVLRVGKGDNQVDNWAAGGLSIGVDAEKGVLRKYGFYKPGHGTKAIEHPDSHIIFENYRIPYLKEAIEQAISFHRHLYGIHSIGWDIAITEEGPCFVEGNDNWEISLMQISNHGLMQEYNRLFY